jgi:hypothetical protein
MHLLNRRQQPDENVALFADEINRLCCWIDPCMPDSDKVRHFMTLVRPEIRSHIILQGDVHTLTAAVLFGKRYENAHGSCR